ncbi:hypothetical protein HWI79_1422 [Cryptosporidium felis]|nr:hypothetical protein HWI79_1422 [Cryptosporidium felis]
MKSVLFVCEDNSSINRNISQRCSLSDRWFFGETEIVDIQNKSLNIPLDNHNFRKFVLDNIFTYNTDDLNSIANLLSERCFTNNSNELVISTSYSFGSNCPLLLEGLFENNILVGPGLFLLVLRNVLSKIQDQTELNKYNLFCTWNGVLNNGEFTDMFEDSHENSSFEMINISSVSEEFGFTSALSVETVNSIATLINNKRKSCDWKGICHYIFTLRIFQNGCRTDSEGDKQVGSVTLVSLGEGIKTRLSGQINPWDVVDIAIKEYSGINESNSCMSHFSRYIGDYFNYPESVMLIYRFPFYISPIKPNHAKEIKFILNMMLFHQTIINFISSEINKLNQDSKKSYFQDSFPFLSDYSTTKKTQDSPDLCDFGYDSPTTGHSYYNSSLFFNNELNDAPLPPPNPIPKDKINNYVLSGCPNEINNPSLIDNFSSISFKNGHNYDLFSNSIHDSRTSPNDLKTENDALKQEINMLESSLIDKNEIIIRLEKLIDSRDQIIKQNQETIRMLKQELNNNENKIRELGDKARLNKEELASTNLVQLKNKSQPGLQRPRPSTAAKVLRKSFDYSEATRTKRDEVRTKSKRENFENNAQDFVKNSENLNSSLSGVAKMAFEKYLKKC